MKLPTHLPLGKGKGKVDGTTTDSGEPEEPVHLGAIHQTSAPLTLTDRTRHKQ